MIEGLLLDLDGTLINQNDQISFRVKDMVKGFAQIIPVSIISGRESKEVNKFANELQLRSIQFSDNGARIIESRSGTTIMAVNIQELLVKNIFDKNFSKVKF